MTAHRTYPFRTLTLAVVLAMATAACGDDGGGADATTTTAPAASSTSATTEAAVPTEAPTTTASAGFSVSSDDGRVTLEVPAGMLEADPGITIAAAAPASLGDDLAALGTGVWAYTLEPAGLVFPEPVRITVEVPLGEAAAEGFPFATPLMSLVATSADGTGWEALGDQLVVRDQTSAYVSGLLTHFSGLAALHEQVHIQTRFIEVSGDDASILGIDFLWSNGTPLMPPAVGGSGFLPEGTGAMPIDGAFSEGLLSVPCPPAVSSMPGTTFLDLRLPAVDGTTGETGAVAAPTLPGVEQTLRTTVALGTNLICRPTISADGSVQIDISIDHPGGVEVIPGEDYLGGLSGMLLELAREFPGLFVGLIRDVDGDGVIDPEDLMYPPFPATVEGGTTRVVLPLFGYGDYIPYFLDGEPPTIATEVTVRDGVTILVGGLTPDRTAVPMLGDLPLLGRVFSDESTQSEEVELVILVTPSILEGDGE